MQKLRDEQGAWLFSLLAVIILVSSGNIAGLDSCGRAEGQLARVESHWGTADHLPHACRSSIKKSAPRADGTAREWRRALGGERTVDLDPTQEGLQESDVNVMRYDTPADQLLKLHNLHNLHKHKLHTDKHLFALFFSAIIKV